MNRALFWMQWHNFMNIAQTILSLQKAGEKRLITNKHLQLNFALDL